MWQAMNNAWMLQSRSLCGGLQRSPRPQVTLASLLVRPLERRTCAHRRWDNPYQVQSISPSYKALWHASWTKLNLIWILRGIFDRTPCFRRSCQAGLLTWLKEAHDKAIKEAQEEEDEDAADGPRFRPLDLTQAQIDDVFGPGVPVRMGNRMLRFQHGRRLQGELDRDMAELGDETVQRMGVLALKWLRKHHPLDEGAALRARLAREERSQRPVVADAEKLGLHKPPVVHGRSSRPSYKAKDSFKTPAPKALDGWSEQAREVTANTGRRDQYLHRPGLCASLPLANGRGVSSPPPADNSATSSVA